MNWRTVILLAACAAVIPGARAISPAELHRQLTNGMKLTVIDVRGNDLYQRAHVLGAINIPASLCAAKKLPPLGRVVVYDSGLGNDNVQTAAAALSAKPGIAAEILEGGFAAWEALQVGDTRGRGAEVHAVHRITYQQLKTNLTDEIVLVDLRDAGPATATKSKSVAPPTDLQQAFPQARVTHSPFNVTGRRKSATGESLPPLLVLIDKGDGAADEMARALRANGITRFTILAGGEEIIAREGQAGMKRSGNTAPLATPTSTSN